MKRIARSTYSVIFWTPLLLLFLAMLAVTPSSTTGGGSQMWFGRFLIAGVVWWFAGRLIALLLIPLLISQLKCPGCGEEISAVSRWDCSCGYHDHRERHVLAGTCPKCGNRTGHINCPRCDCTILLW